MPLNIGDQLTRRADGIVFKVIGTEEAADEDGLNNRLVYVLKSEDGEAESIDDNEIAAEGGRFIRMKQPNPS